ncbi:hypothetical protein ACFX1Q_032481 [Malus domestica]
MCKTPSTEFDVQSTFHRIRASSTRHARDSDLKTLHPCFNSLRILILIQEPYVLQIAEVAGDKHRRRSLGGDLGKLEVSGIRRLCIINSLRFDNPHNDKGIIPDKEFREKSIILKLLQFPISTGIAPKRPFYHSSNCCSFLSFPSSHGIEPKRLFL